MTRCVLDTSAALAMIFSDERQPADLQLLREIGVEGAVVTGLWHLEIANVVLMTERRKRIDRAERRRVMSELADLPLAIDDRNSDFAWTETMTLAERHDLTVYDASYLELCVRIRLPLATRDKALQRAMSTLGLTIC